MAKTLRPIRRGQVKVFKIKNRRGFAAMCKSNLTEGRTVQQAMARMAKPLKRQGFLLNV